MASSRPEPRLLGVKLYPALPWLLWLALTAGTLFLFPTHTTYRFKEPRLNAISREEIIAPFTFEILKSEEQLAAERREAQEDVDPVVSRVDSVEQAEIRQLASTMRAIGEARDSLSRYRRDLEEVQLEKRRALYSDLRERYDVLLNYESWSYLLEDLERRDPFLESEQLTGVLRDLYARGVLARIPSEDAGSSGNVSYEYGGEERTVEKSRFYTLVEARGEARSLLSDLLEEKHNLAPGDSAIKVGYELLTSFIEPNILFDQEETDARQELAYKNVPLVTGTIFKDERIIDSNERFTEYHLDVLRSMEIKRAELAREEGGLRRWMPWIANFLFAGFVYFFFGLWLYKYRRDIFGKPNRILLLFAMLGLLVALYGLVFLQGDVSPYLFPAALGAIILTILFDAQIALLFVMPLALIVAGFEGGSITSLLQVFVPSSLSLFAVLRVRTRVQIMRASFLILVGYLLVILIQRTLTYQLLEMMALQDLLHAAINALATPLVALGVLILIELIFRETSDLTLLELADLNRPLLKRLSLEAPGTYHHSIMVGNLAEAGAEAIDANPLLVRAGAYYHDIGKMARREYFVENQLGSGNIHDSLDPEESAKMLADHVEQGVRIAEKYHLPEAIRAFIREHHGTGLMMFFYNKALEEKPSGTVDESTFRYPGPKPQSKETGILMLADSAEAATRSLEDPSHEKIMEVVRNVIISRYRDEELDECPLTLHDLRVIMEAFVPILRGIHHHRIRYPSRDEMARNRGESRPKGREPNGEQSRDEADS